MTHYESVVATAQATFGRDAAMFESLLGFVAQLSVVLWSLVILTAVIRFVCIRIYRRGSARTAPAETVASSAAVPATTAPVITMSEATVPTTTAVMDLVQPVAVAPSLNVRLRATRNRRAEPRHAAHAQAFAANSTEA